MFDVLTEDQRRVLVWALVAEGAPGGWLLLHEHEERWARPISEAGWLEFSPTITRAVRLTDTGRMAARLVAE